jgi:polar amino acid transport system substrate-binding protein
MRPGGSFRWILGRHAGPEIPIGRHSQSRIDVGGPDMRQTITRSRRLTAAGLAVIATLIVAACGSSGTPGSSSSSAGGSSGISVQPNIASEVPSAIKSKGAIQVATDATYAPNEFIDPASGQIKGWDIDFAKALSTVLGIPFVISNADFATIIPDLGTRYDLGVSSFSPTAEREKTVDFVTYYQAGEAWLIKTGGTSVTQASDLCGKTVAVETGTTEESDAWGFMGKKPDGTAIAGDPDNCAKAGKSDITVASFGKQTDANSALTGGRAQVGWLDQPVAQYQTKVLQGQLQLTGQPCSVAPYGIAIAKGSGMIKPLTDAIKYLIDKGYYAQVLKNWNVASGAITSSAVALNNNSSVGPTCVPSY